MLQNYLAKIGKQKKSPAEAELFSVLKSRDDWIRTSDLFVPNEARYRPALHPETGPQK